MSVRLYIGNLPFEVTGEDLNTLFSTIGVVEDAIIVTHSLVVEDPVDLASLKWKTSKMLMQPLSN